MNAIEDEVRSLLRSKVTQAPVREEPPPVVLRRTRVMRGVNALTVAAGAAAAVAGVVLGVQLVSGRGETGPAGPVPWLAVPIEQPSGRATPPIRECRSLDVVPVGFVDDRRLPEGIQFTAHTPDVRCRIDPRTGFGLVIRDGKLNPLPVDVELGDLEALDVDGKLLPGGGGFKVIWQNYCGPRPAEIVVDVELENSMVRAGVWDTLPPCENPDGPSVLLLTGWFAIIPDGVQPTPEVPRSPLVPSIEAPAQVRRGQTLAYRVTLENTSDKPLPLDPCPTFAQGFRTSHSQVFLSSYRLNCAAVPGLTIPARGRVTFEMRMDVPASFRPGVWTLSWSFRPDPRQGASRVIEIF